MRNTLTTKPGNGTRHKRVRSTYLWVFKNQDAAASHHIKREVSKVLRPNEKLARINVLNFKGTILKKINVPFNVNFCLDRYNLSLDIS